MNDELKNADEIARALRCCGNPDTKKPDCEHCPLLSTRLCVKTMLEGAADLIDSLTTQLSASQRREKAAVELIRKIYDTTDDNFCDSCRKIVRMIEIWWGDDEKGSDNGN